MIKEKKDWQRSGRISYALIGGLLGAPTILVLLLLFWGGCTKW